MLVLFETPAGHALFKVLDDAAVRDAGINDLESQNTIKNLVRLKAFSRFADTTAALSSATALVEGKASKELRKFLKKEASAGEEIAVGDAKLGQAIKEKTGLQCVFSQKVADIMRGIRTNLEVLLADEQGSHGTEAARGAMVLGLAHSLSRYKLKFSPDKVDTMIVQAIGLLDDLDKEINTYAMRLREWYGWHFPELGKIVADNMGYARAVDLMGMRTSAKKLDFSAILPEETEEELKEAAEVSMGTEISDEDLLNIRALCSQVVTLGEYRMTLYEYLRNRMTAIAPNLTAMVGELVGARLISHAGSLLSLAKYPASTVQILGAEKALFRALKTKHATPKYGLIYHASVVGQAAPKNKGKISRSLASKCSLAIRVDALGDTGEEATVGESGRLAVEARLRQLEGKTEFSISKLGRSNEKTPKYSPGPNAGKGYNEAADMLLSGNGVGRDDGFEKKRKKKAQVQASDGTVAGTDRDHDLEAEHDGSPEGASANGHNAEPDSEVVTPAKKLKKKEKAEKMDEGDEKSDKKSDKKKRKREASGAVDEASGEERSAKKEKKKKRKSSGGED
jgi:nucleolar protein 58